MYKVNLKGFITAFSVFVPHLLWLVFVTYYHSKKDNQNFDFNSLLKPAISILLMIALLAYFPITVLLIYFLLLRLIYIDFRLLLIVYSQFEFSEATEKTFIGMLDVDSVDLFNEAAYINASSGYKNELVGL